MFRKNIFIFFIGVILIFTTSCGSNNNKPNEETNTAPTVSTESSNTQKESTPESSVSSDPDFVFPDANRPIAVMIDNEGVKPLPQGGLNKAQVIYEIIVEGGATRLMPMFWGTDPTLIGPVRSSRHYFLDYSMEHDAIYVHFGGSPMAYTDLKKLHINDLDGVTGRDGGVFWDLTKDRNNWQDSYTSMEKIKEQIKKLKYKTTTEKKLVFAYNKQGVEPINGQQAAKVSIQYTKDYWCGFTYEPATKKYLRFRKDKTHMERTDNQQLTAKNIIIQNVSNNTIAGDKAGRQVLGDVGKGDGWFITCGKAIKIKWSKTSRDAQTKYMDESGTGIILNPGQTWVEILPLSGKVKLE